MDSTIFELDWTTSRSELHEDFHSTKSVTFYVPTLPAYAIAYSELIGENGIDAPTTRNIEGREYHIEGDTLVWRSPVLPLIPSLGSSRLIIHYHGIRDYEALFPSVKDADIRRRVAQFQEEAESVFETKAWMSYVILSTAVLEGLLVWRLGKLPLNKLIQKAHAKSWVDEAGSDALHNARRRRNLVHAGKANQPYVTRLEAMDVRTSMDGLIKALSREVVNLKTV